MKYYSQLLNRAISYNKQLINPEKIEEIIDFIKENGCPKYRVDNDGKIFKYSKKHKAYIYLSAINLQTKEAKYILKMCWKIYIMFLDEKKIS